jgi:two-component system, OmpR family, sensor kinase
MTTRARAVLLGLAVVIGVSGCISGVLYALIAGGAGANQDKTLKARADAARAALATAPAAAFVRTPPVAPLDPAGSDEVFVIVLGPDGTPISWTGGRDPRLPAEALAAPDGNATVTIDGVQVRVHVEPWRREDLDRTGWVAAAQALHSRKSSLAGVFVVIVISGIVTLLAAGLAIWLVSRRLQAAHRRTAEALAGQQRFAADASHELRTPLTTILNNAGFLRAHPDAAPTDRAAAVADIEAEAQRMSRLVADLLTLARADGGSTLAPAAVDVGALAHEVCRQATAKHPDRSLHCAGTPVTVRGNADALTQLLWILLDNAVRHTADGGNIWVSVASRGPHAATLQVADDGEGIPPGAELRIFDRFFQADPARGGGGAGLGLSIAQWVARAHRGAITAATNDRGGATFTVAISSIS